MNHVIDVRPHSTFLISKPDKTNTYQTGTNNQHIFHFFIYNQTKQNNSQNRQKRLPKSASTFLPFVTAEDLRQSQHYTEYLRREFPFYHVTSENKLRNPFMLR